MARWRNQLGILAAGLLSLAGLAAPASAQFPLLSDRQPEPASKDPFSIKDTGSPNAFTDLYGIRVRRDPIVREPSLMSNWLPRLFRPTPSAGKPAEFPNPAEAPSDTVSALSVQEGGMPNGFTELTETRPRVCFPWLVGTKLFVTDSFAGQQPPDPHVLSFRAEYLNWAVSRTGPSAALVTTTSNAPIERGALDQPSTAVLVPISNTSIDYGNMSGTRYTFGLACGYLPPFEVSTFSFHRNVTLFSGGSSDASGIFLARPVQLVDIPVVPNQLGVGTEDVEFVNVPLIPGVTGANGTISIISRLTFWGLDANFFCPLIESDTIKIDCILGYRYAALYESLDITSSIGGFIGDVNFGGVTFPALFNTVGFPGNGFSTVVNDSFRTANVFNGGQIGLRGSYNIGAFALQSDAKLGIGTTRQTLTINGASTLIQPVPGRPAPTLPGGVLALPSNSGSASENHFSVIPEVNLTLSYQLRPYFRLYGGFNVLSWSNVIRPGDHINSVVDSRQIPTDQNFNPAAATRIPAFPAIVQRDFFARGFFAGIEIGF